MVWHAMTRRILGWLKSIRAAVPAAPAELCRPKAVPPPTDLRRGGVVLVFWLLVVA